MFKRFLGDTLDDKEAELLRLISTQDEPSIQNYTRLHWKEINFKKKGPRGYTLLEEAILNKCDWLSQFLLEIEKGIPVDDALILASKVKNSHVVNFLLDSIHNSVIPTNPTCSSETIPINDDRKDNFSVDEESKMVSPKDSDEKVKDVERVNESRSEVKKDENDRYKKLKRNPVKKGSAGSQMKMEKISQVFPLPLFSPVDVLRKGAVVENVDIVQSLVNAGIRLPEINITPSSPSGDTLKEFAAKLELCKAKSSPAYIAFSEQDPILASFHRNNETLRLSKKFPEYKDDLKYLAIKSEQFAVDLLQLCQSSHDVFTLLKLSSGITTPYARVQYGRLHQALQFNQKKFIAHPNCQNVVNNLWTKGLSSWRNWNNLRRMQHVLVQAILMPFIMMLAVFGSSSSCTSATRVPINRFIYSMTSYCSFLALLTAVLLNGSPVKCWMAAAALCFSVSALLRLFITDLPMEGLRNFRRYFWNIYDAVLFTMMTISFSCILTDQSELSFSNYLLPVGESLLALAAILGYSRVLCWFHISSTLGPFIIAFQKILFVVFRLLSVFTVLFIAFAFSLYFLYNRQQEEEDEEEEKSFAKLADSFSLLFWALYGHGEDTYSIPESSENNSSFNNSSSSSRDLKLVELTGTFIWGFFHVAFVIILLNMLIAMMTNTFERIQIDCDREWKFARTKMLIYYFEKCTAIPEPFNVIHYIITFPQWLLKSIKLKLNKSRKRTKEWSEECPKRLNILHQQCSKEEMTDDYEQREYSELINRLITDYFRQKNADGIFEY